MSATPTPPSQQETQQTSTADAQRWVEAAGVGSLSEPATQPRVLTTPSAIPAELVENDEVPAFRPIMRPPLALLCLRDDGLNEGEWIRLRQESFVIGRTDGDIRIAHDSQMSARHLVILRVQRGGQWRWLVRDLESTNGTYASVESGLLERPNDFLVGSRRFRFELPELQSAGSDSVDRGGTQQWQSISAEQLTKLAPSIVEITPRGPGQRYPLVMEEAWIGSDPKCAIPIDDPFVNRRHARLFRDPEGRWHIESSKTRNGLWVRIREITVDRYGEFQAGEQRLALKVLR